MRWCSDFSLSRRSIPARSACASTLRVYLCWGGYTTVMLRNIPNKYTREMLVKQLNQDSASEALFSLWVAETPKMMICLVALM